MKEAILYECGICSCYHPWSWRGDCRDNANRHGSPEEYANLCGVPTLDIEVRAWEDRLTEDLSE